MRDSEKPATLNELMGDGGKPMSLEDLPGLLGEKMPEISYDRVGKLRLINALHQRFGPGYNNIPGIKDIMSHFERQTAVHSTIKLNRRHQ